MCVCVCVCVCLRAGLVLSEPFQTLPSRRLYPDYYDEIKNPIALRQIKRKMKVCRQLPIFHQLFFLRYYRYSFYLTSKW